MARFDVPSPSPSPPPSTPPSSRKRSFDDFAASVEGPEVALPVADSQEEPVRQRELSTVSRVHLWCTTLGLGVRDLATRLSGLFGEAAVATYSAVAEYNPPKRLRVESPGLPGSWVLGVLDTPPPAAPPTPPPPQPIPERRGAWWKLRLKRRRSRSIAVAKEQEAREVRARSEPEVSYFLLAGTRGIQLSPVVEHQDESRWGPLDPSYKPYERREGVQAQEQESATTPPPSPPKRKQQRRKRVCYLKERKTVPARFHLPPLHPDRVKRHSRMNNYTDTIRDGHGHKWIQYAKARVEKFEHVAKGERRLVDDKKIEGIIKRAKRIQHQGLVAFVERNEREMKQQEEGMLKQVQAAERELQRLASLAKKTKVKHDRRLRYLEAIRKARKNPFAEYWHISVGLKPHTVRRKPSPAREPASQPSSRQASPEPAKSLPLLQTVKQQPAEQQPSVLPPSERESVLPPSERASVGSSIDWDPVRRWDNWEGALSPVVEDEEEEFTLPLEDQESALPSIETALPPRAAARTASRQASVGQTKEPPRTRRSSRLASVEPTKKQPRSRQTSRAVSEDVSSTGPALITPLSEEWSAKIDELMNDSNNKDPNTEVAQATNNIPLLLKTFTRILADGEHGSDSWLDDDAVNAFMSALVDAMNKAAGWSRDTNDVPPYAAFNSAWYNTYIDRSVTGIKNWARRQGIQGQRLLQSKGVIFPVNKNNHWTLVYIDLKKPDAKSIEYLDSLGVGGNDEVAAVRSWLQQELGPAYKERDWPRGRERSHRQSNGSDCGVFTCFNALAATQGREYKAITADRMPLARRQMAAILLNGGFKDDFQLPGSAMPHQS